MCSFVDVSHPWQTAYSAAVATNVRGSSAWGRHPAPHRRAASIFRSRPPIPRL